MQQETAEVHALNALAWLVAEDEVLPIFLGSTGASADEVKARAADPVFLASALDFILMDDAWVVACARALNIAPDQIQLIRAALPGGDLPNWT